MRTLHETRWFSLSRRELAVLAVAVAVALSAVGLTRAIAYVWSRGEISVTETGDTLVLPARLNVNTAKLYELTMLPGIGPKIAEAIVEEREWYGPFDTLEDLARVSGIGPVRIESIRPYAMCAPVAESSDQAED